MNFLLTLTKRQLLYCLAIHYILMGMILTWAITIGIILNGMYIEYKVRQTLESITRTTK